MKNFKKYKNIAKIFGYFLFLSFFIANNLVAKNQKTSITNFKLDNNSAEIKLDGFVKYKLYNGKAKERVIIEFFDVSSEKFNIDSNNPKYLEKLDIKYKNNNYYILIDFNKKYKISSKNFDIKKNIITFNVSIKNEYDHKNIDDKFENNQDDLGLFIEKKVLEKNTEANNEYSSTTDYNLNDNLPKKINEKNSKNNNKKIILKPKKPIIVIDAGHGGKDPGAIGSYARSKEKNLTLSYAKELAKNLINEGKYDVYLTRENDIFISLDKRVSKSRRKKADLFISLHVNANNDKSISGFSIYTLSDKSSDKQAEILANKENQVDVIHGIDFDDASKDIVKTLIDLSQRESKNRSAELAKFVIDEVKNSNIEILQNTHRFAGFRVLTAPDMASILIELGYISNKKEEAMLNSSKYRRKVAKTLTLAINNYFKNNKITYE